MDISIYLARIFGVYLVVACLAVFINRKNLSKILQDFSNSPGLVLFTGFMHLLFGLLVVTAHNIWTPDFKGVVTFIGWVGIFKGVLRLLAPTKIIRFGEEFASGKKLIAWGIIWLFMGFYLIIAGFSLK